MHASRISALLLALLITSGARAQDIAPELRRPMLLQGAYGVGYGLGVAAFGAGLGSLITAARCSNEGEGEPICDRGIRVGAGRGALLGAALGYLFGVPLMIAHGYEREGERHGLRGDGTWVFTASVATALAMMTLTAWSMAHYSDRVAAETVPLGTAGVLSMLAAPWGLGYVTYRGTHRRAVERMISPTGFVVRF